jgi:predicted PurR-regulated permease PerM
MNETAGARRQRARSNIVFTFAIGLALYLAWLLRHVLLLIYVSALFAVVLKPLVCSISDLHIGRWKPFRRAAIIVLVFFIFAALAGFAFLALPPALDDLSDFARDIPTRLPQILDNLKHVPLLNHLDTNNITTQFANSITGSATSVLHSLKDWASALFTLAMGFILTVYFSLEGEVAYRWVLSFLAPVHRERLDSTLRRAEARMQRWLLGQGSLMLILGLASTATYLLLHIRYAYALGFLTGLLNIIPVVGAAVCIGLALFVGAIDSWGRVLGVAIFYVVWVNLENSLLIPRIMKSSVDLPGLSVLVGLVIGSELAGVTGALVSVPTTVLVSVLLDEYLVKKA